MQRRSIRISLLTILLAGSLTAGFFLQHIDGRAADVRAADADVSARIARLADALVDVAAAQHAYVTPGQAAEPWFERMTALVGTLRDEMGALGSSLHSPDAHVTVEGFTAGIEALVAADTRVRENLRLGQPLMAADVIFSDSRSTIDTMLGRLRELRAAEAQAIDAQHADLGRQRWLTFAGLALLWTGVLGLLLWTPARRDAQDVTALPEPQGASGEKKELAPTSVDLTAAASLCVDLSRVSSGTALPDLLERAASLVDSPGIILWMAAGEELFAVTAHGYPPQVLARLGSIPRKADNATASAWREARVVTVPATAGGNGAIVTPLFGVDTCIGVLAAEVRPGREADTAAQAVITMVAAQLAAVVSAWPAPSSGELRVEASA